MTGSSLQKIKGICKKLSNTDLSRSPPGKSSRYHVNYVLSKSTSKLSCTLVSLRRLTTLWLKKKKKTWLFFCVHQDCTNIPILYTHSSLLPGQLTVTAAPTNVTAHRSSESWHQRRGSHGNRQLRCARGTLMSSAFLPSARSTHQPEKKTKHFHLSSLPQCPRTLPLLILHQV